jgi:superfamily I DNA/RNA helicase
MVIPYNIVNGSSPWTDKFLGTYRAFYAIKNRMPVDREDLDALFEVVPSRGILRYGTKTNVSNMKSQNVPFGEVASMFEMTFDINDLARFINFKHESQKLVQRDLFMSLNIRNMKPIKREDVTLDLGTIHSIKGGQRGLVFLSNSINGKIENQIIEDPDLADEERRLFYVGATRSSGDLVIMDKFFGKRTFELPEF